MEAAHQEQLPHIKMVNEADDDEKKVGILSESIIAKNICDHPTSSIAPSMGSIRVSLV